MWSREPIGHNIPFLHFPFTIPSSHVDQITQTAATSLPHWILEVNYSMVVKSSGIPKSWFTPSSATSLLREEAL